MTASVFLIGYRGSGKSTVGRALAERFGLAFVDSDREIEQRQRRSIATIFRDEGEAAFRDLEAQAVEAICSRCDEEPLVVATGGGAILRAGNVEAMRARGPLVWLHADPAELARRIEADPRSSEDRPALSTGGSASEEVEPVYSSRLAAYRGAATHEIDTTDLGPAQVVEALAAIFETRRRR